MFWNHGSEPIEIMFEPGMSPMMISASVEHQEPENKIEVVLAGPLTQLTFLPKSIAPAGLRSAMQTSVVFCDEHPLPICLTCDEKRYRCGAGADLDRIAEIAERVVGKDTAKTAAYLKTLEVRVKTWLALADTRTTIKTVVDDVVTWVGEFYTAKNCRYPAKHRALSILRNSPMKPLSMKGRPIWLGISTSAPSAVTK